MRTLPLKIVTVFAELHGGYLRWNGIDLPCINNPGFGEGPGYWVLEIDDSIRIIDKIKAS